MSKQRDQTSIMGGVWNIANAGLRSRRGTGGQQVNNRYRHAVVCLPLRPQAVAAKFIS
jgi:hypothetical protein